MQQEQGGYQHGTPTTLMPGIEMTQATERMPATVLTIAGIPA